MNSTILHGTISHARHKIVNHAFSYPLYMVGIDLSEIQKLSESSNFFGYNKLRVLSVWDGDYLNSSSKSILEKLSTILHQHQIDDVTQVFLITVPRYFGYTFNPVSFYVSRTKDGEINGFVAEVNNTFGEKHIYVEKPPSGASHLPLRFRFPKRFFVSPFFEVSGEYEIVIHSLESEIKISVNLFEGDREIFSTLLDCSQHPFTERELLSTLIRFPLSAFLTMGRIYTQAVILGWRYKLGAYLKPSPSSPHTLRSFQNIIHRLRLLFLSRFMRSAT